MVNSNILMDKEIIYHIEQDRFATCFKTCGTGPLLEGGGGWVKSACTDRQFGIAHLWCHFVAKAEQTHTLLFSISSSKKRVGLYKVIFHVSRIMFIWIISISDHFNKLCKTSPGFHLLKYLSWLEKWNNNGKKREKRGFSAVFFFHKSLSTIWTLTILSYGTLL